VTAPPDSKITWVCSGPISMRTEHPAAPMHGRVGDPGQLGRERLGIFDAFPDDPGRQAQLWGPGGGRTDGPTAELLVQPPVIEPVDVLAAVLDS